MWQDLKHRSPQLAALYMAKESEHTLHSQPRPEDVLDGIPVSRAWIALKYGVLCVSAIAAGILAAALQSS